MLTSMRAGMTAFRTDWRHMDRDAKKEIFGFLLIAPFTFIFVLSIFFFIIAFVIILPASGIVWLLHTYVDPNLTAPIVPYVQAISPWIDWAFEWAVSGAIVGFLGLMGMTWLCGTLGLLPDGRVPSNARMPAEAPPRVRYEQDDRPVVKWTDRYPTGESKHDASVRHGWIVVSSGTALGAIIGFGIGHHWAPALLVAFWGFLITWALRPQVLRQKLFLQPPSPYDAAGFHEATCIAEIVPRDGMLWLKIGRSSEQHGRENSTYRHPRLAMVRWDADNFSNFELRRYSEVFSRQGKGSQIRDDYVITLASDTGPVLIAHSGLEFAHSEALRKRLELEFTGAKRTQLLEEWRRGKSGRSPDDDPPPDDDSPSGDPEIPKSL